MAKKSRRPVRADSSTPRPVATLTGEPRTTASEERATRRTRPRRARQQSPLERYRSLIIGGVGAVGVLILLWLLFGSASTAAYTCGSMLTPGPVESLTPRPTLPPTPTPAVTATPAPTATPAVTGTPAVTSTPAATGTPAASATPAASPSPGASATPDASGTPAPSPTPAPAPTPRLGFTTALAPDSLHVPLGSSINYISCPPTSGRHYNNPPQRGPIPAAVYQASEERTPGGWVHNLEHGYTVLLYRCPGGVLGGENCPTQAEFEQMTQWFNEAPTPPSGACPKKALVARFDSMETRFALVAWGRAYLFDEFDLDTALTFAQQWTDHDAVPERPGC